jgi:hypothetical protein
MSDINPKRMIPLYVCDQAVAACDAEIAKLREENARLRKAGDAMDAYLKRQDGTTNGMLDCRLQWLAAKETNPHA